MKITKSDGGIIELWPSRNALVLKALTIVLSDAFEVLIKLEVSGVFGVPPEIIQYANRALSSP